MKLLQKVTQSVSASVTKCKSHMGEGGGQKSVTYQLNGPLPPITGLSVLFLTISNFEAHVYQIYVGDHSNNM